MRAPNLLQGMLDLLVLGTLKCGSYHGHGIARSIETWSRKSLVVDSGSLYPALQRLHSRNWIRARWGTSDNNRRARYYELTALGRRQFDFQASRWRELAGAVARILDRSCADS